MDRERLERFPREAREEARSQATTLLSSGVPAGEARAELVDNGIPAELAEATVDAIVAGRRERWRSTATGLFWTGALLLAGGAAVTAWSWYTAPGETYLLATGALAGGVSSILVGAGMLARPR